MPNPAGAPPPPGNRFVKRSGGAAPAKATPVDPVRKELKVKLGSLKRNVRDMEYARREVDVELKRLEGIKANNPERVNQQQNVVNEARMMVPHSENRVRDTLADLRAFVARESTNISDDWEEVAQVPDAIEAAEKSLAGGN